MLKYLFSVEYLDGSRYSQNSKDISIKDPSRSCFYDLDLYNIHKFHLLGDNEQWTVAMDSLHIHHIVYSSDNEGSCLNFHVKPKLSNVRPIYFRRVTQRFNQKELIGESVEYHLGFQGNQIDGSNYQETIIIK